MRRRDGHFVQMLQSWFLMLVAVVEYRSFVLTFSDVCVSIDCFQFYCIYWRGIAAFRWGLSLGTVSQRGGRLDFTL